MTDFVFLFEFGLAAMVYVLSGRDDDYACRFGSYQDLDCVASSLFFFFCFRVCWNRDANCHSCASLSLTHVLVGGSTVQTLGRVR